jgi:hypothetical protein
LGRRDSRCRDAGAAALPASGGSHGDGSWHRLPSTSASRVGGRQPQPEEAANLPAVPDVPTVDAEIVDGDNGRFAPERAQLVHESILGVAHQAAVSLAQLQELLDVAKAGEIWKALPELKCRTWAEYTKKALNGSEIGKILTTQERQAFIEVLGTEGMSLRDIAESVGVSKDTAARALAKGKVVRPKHVMSADGRERPSIGTKKDAEPTVADETDDADDVADDTGSPPTVAAAAFKALVAQMGQLAKLQTQLGRGLVAAQKGSLCLSVEDVSDLATYLSQAAEILGDAAAAFMSAPTVEAAT